MAKHTGPAGLMMSDEPETGGSEDVTQLKTKLRVLKDAYRKLNQQLEAVNMEANMNTKAHLLAQTQAQEALSVARAEAQQAKNEKADLEKKSKEASELMVESAVRNAVITERNAKLSLEQQVQSLTTRLELLQRDRETLMEQIQTKTKPAQPEAPTMEKLMAALEAFQITREVTLPERVAIRTYAAMYVCCTNIMLVKHPLVANRESVSTWETFTVQQRGPKRFALVTHMGRYVEVDKKGAVFAGKTADQKDASEQGDKAEEFVVEYGPFAAGSWLSWQSVLTGKYLSADRKGHLHCREGTTGSPWEWFHIEAVK